MVAEENPMATPRMKRPAIRSSVELANPIVSEPIVKITLEIKMIVLRPGFCGENSPRLVLGLELFKIQRNQNTPTQKKSDITGHQ